MAILEQQARPAMPSAAHRHRAPAGNLPRGAAGSEATDFGSDEIGLVERARSGDADAFDKLIALRLTPTYRLVRSVLGGTEESEDATQEAFIAAWRGLPNLRQAERFDAWFARIVINACRMSMRRRPRAVVVSIDTITGGHPAAEDDRSLSDFVESDALNRAIDRLPVEQRAILALYYLEDRPVSGVAAILGVPPGTVKWRLSQARAALRRVIAADVDGVSVSGAIIQRGT